MGNAEEVIKEVMKAADVLVLSVLDTIMKSAMESSSIDETGERTVSMLKLINIFDIAKETIQKGQVIG